MSTSDAEDAALAKNVTGFLEHAEQHGLLNEDQLQMAAVRITSSGGITIDPGAAPEAIAAALDAMERDAVLTPAMERLRIASYLTTLARDLMAFNPQAHVRVERVGGPQPMIVIAITRQLYPEGHLANDEPPQHELFDPTL